jgi:CRISPR/Cas system CSM-associated protein Csm3 (group 7 of RAMP superfamily)
MLHRLVNECRFTLTIETKGPFIIREGRLRKAETEVEKAKKVQGDPDSLPIRRVWHGNRGDFALEQDYYLPGTSLRGVLRSHLERILRTMEPTKMLCCDPLKPKGPEQGCSAWFGEQKRLAGPPYAHSCAVCRLFGSTGQASRIRIADSPTIRIPAAQLSYRDHIGIDRFTGGVCSGANFRDLVIEAGVQFQHDVMIRNFELWQLGLLAYVWRDLYCWQDGLIRLGYGKTKGYGQVQGVVGDIFISYYGYYGASLPTPTPLLDLGALLPEAEGKKYDLKPGRSDAELLEPQPPTIPYAKTYRVTDSARFWQEAAQIWGRQRQSFPPLAALRPAAKAAAAPNPEEQP